MRYNNFERTDFVSICIHIYLSAYIRCLYSFHTICPDRRVSVRKTEMRMSDSKLNYVLDYVCDAFLNRYTFFVECVCFVLLCFFSPRPVNLLPMCGMLIDISFHSRASYYWEKTSIQGVCVCVCVFTQLLLRCNSSIWKYFKSWYSRFGREWNECRCSDGFHILLLTNIRNVACVYRRS